MSILFRTFVVEIRNISQTPKNNKNMTTTNPKIIKALEYINAKGLSNNWWHIVTNEVDAHTQYGTEEPNITLPPHIAIWRPDVTVDYEYLQLPADKVFTLLDDEEETIIYL